MSKFLASPLFRFGALLTLVLLLQMPLLVQAQKKYKTHGTKCRRVEIVDPGELYSTYEMSGEDHDLLTENEGLSEDLYQVIVDGGTEVSPVWPEGMRTLDSRLENAATFKKYVAFEVAEFGERHVLVIPARYNKSMPAGFVPEEDFFIIISNQGIN